MATYDQIVDALADAFQGTNAHVYPGDLPSVQVPAIVIGWPEEYDPYTDLGDASDYVIRCRVEVAGSRDVKSGNQALRPFIDRTGSQSLCAALDNDNTLGGVVDSARVLNFVDFGYRELAENNIVVQCYARIAVMS